MAWWQNIIASIRPPLDVQQLAAFIDGDGSIYFSGQGAMCIGITQCSYETLRKIQDVYGGTMRKRDPKKETNRQGDPSNHRHQYTLVFRGIQIAGILPAVAPHLALKDEKAELMLQYLALFKKQSKDARAIREGILQEFTSVKNRPMRPRVERITWRYICGLFQAEGCLQINSLSIAQKQCPDILHAIKAFMEQDLQMPLGNVNEQCFVTSRRPEIRAILSKFEDVGLFHNEKLHQIHAFHQNDIDELKRLKHVDDDTPLHIIEEGNAKALELSHEFRMIWRQGAGVQNTTRPARFADRPVPLTDGARDKAISLLKLQLPLSDIASQLGSTKQQVRYLAEQQGITTSAELDQRATTVCIDSKITTGRTKFVFKSSTVVQTTQAFSSVKAAAQWVVQTLHDSFVVSGPRERTVQDWINGNNAPPPWFSCTRSDAKRKRKAREDSQ